MSGRTQMALKDMGVFGVILWPTWGHQLHIMGRVLRNFVAEMDRTKTLVLVSFLVEKIFGLRLL